MLQTLAIVFPLFALMGVGFAALRLHYVGEEAEKGLADFVFLIAIPVLLFRSMVETKAPAVTPWSYLALVYGGIAAAWIVAQVIAMRLLGRAENESIVAGFAAAQSNGVFIGIPLILRAFGEEGYAPLIIVVATHVPVMMVVGAILLERVGRKADWAGLAISLIKNPIILAMVVGLAWRFLGLPLPALIRPAIDGLAAAAVPAALVSVGMALSRYGIGRDVALPALVTTLKLVGQPLLVWWIAFFWLSLPPVWAGTAVLLSACPTGINAYLFAQRYGAGAATTASAIALSTALSVFGIAFWLWVLGVR